MEPEDYRESSRGARYATYLQRRVKVYQSVGLYDGVVENSCVGWLTIDTVPPERAEEFARAILAAVDLARQWDAERAGKPVEPAQEE